MTENQNSLFFPTWLTNPFDLVEKYTKDKTWGHLYMRTHYTFSLSLCPLEDFVSFVASEVCKDAQLYLGFL